MTLKEHANQKFNKNKMLSKFEIINQGLIKSKKIEKPAPAISFDPKNNDFDTRFPELSRTLTNYDSIMKEAPNENPVAYWKYEEEYVLTKFEN